MAQDATIIREGTKKYVASFSISPCPRCFPQTCRAVVLTFALALLKDSNASNQGSGRVELANELLLAR